MIRKTLIDQTQLLVLQLCVITSSDRSSLDTETAKHIIVSGSATCFVWLMCCDSYCIGRVVVMYVLTF